MLCLTGQVPIRRFLGKGRGHLHEMPDQLATLRTFVKWAERIEYPGVAPTMVGRAFQEMLSGRRGPVSLEMPWDCLHAARGNRRGKGIRSLPGTAALIPDPDQDQLRGSLIADSKTPMIFVGSGAIDAAR